MIINKAVARVMVAFWTRSIIVLLCFVVFCGEIIFIADCCTGALVAVVAVDDELEQVIQYGSLEPLLSCDNLEALHHLCIASSHSNRGRGWSGGPLCFPRLEVLTPTHVPIDPTAYVSVLYFLRVRNRYTGNSSR